MLILSKYMVLRLHPHFNMIHASIIGLCLTTILLTNACSSDEPGGLPQDVEKPVIADGDVPNPIDCQIYHRGESIPLRYTFTDNQELGNFNVEVHNNFDHHTHSTSASECELAPIKSPVHPWVFNQDYTIPDGRKTYATEIDIPIPSNIDTGDYHFMLRLTDKAGWQQLKAISIKIVE